MYPKRHQTFTASEVEQLDLLDQPFYQVQIGDHLGVIQTSHLTCEELLSVPGFADSRWTYERTTSESIPLFRCLESEDAIKLMVDFEPFVDPWSLEEKALWITPKGFPRAQD